MYQFFYRTVLSRISAETAHHLSFGALRALCRVPFLAAALRKLSTVDHPALSINALGLRFSNPLGLAAGFDKDARGPRAMASLGFGCIEIGTVTGQSQPGNPTPRLFRLMSDRALLNRMGFNNEGSAVAAERLSAQAKARARRFVLGVNIGKTKVVPEPEAVDDYVLSTQRLARHADYLVVNVSSPNTPGLRNLQAVDALRPLLQAVRSTLDSSTERHVPLLVKIAPDLSDPDVDAVADLALELNLDGIIATNTTISRDGLHTDPARVASLGAGGISGAPLKARSLEVLRRLRTRVGDKVCLIAVGGIETADDAWARIRAGASLLQGYTGLIYYGPFWPKTLQRGLLAKLRASGFARLSDAIGSEVTGRPVRHAHEPDASSADA